MKYIHHIIENHIVWCVHICYIWKNILLSHHYSPWMWNTLTFPLNRYFNWDFNALFSLGLIFVRICSIMVLSQKSLRFFLYCRSQQGQIWLVYDVMVTDRLLQVVLEASMLLTITGHSKNCTNSIKPTLVSALILEMSCGQKPCDL